MQRNGRQCNASRWTFDLLYGRFVLRASANSSALSKGRHFVKEEADYEHGMWGDTPPASKVPMRADEFHIGRVGELKDLLNSSLVKALGNLEQWLSAEIFAVRRAPDGDVESFLFDLVGNIERAEVSTCSTRRNIDWRTVTIRGDARIRSDQMKRSSQVGFPWN